MMKPTADAAKINSAAESMPKSGGAKAAGGQSMPVGNETKADMSGALMGKPTDKNPLKGAIQELGAQHPHSYADHGPHHGGMEHVRHDPVVKAYRGA